MASTPPTEIKLTMKSGVGGLEEALLPVHPPLLPTRQGSNEVWGATAARARFVPEGSDLCQTIDAALLDIERDPELDKDAFRCPTSSPSRAGAQASSKTSDVCETDLRAPTPPTGTCQTALSSIPGIMIGTTMNMMLSVPFGLAFFPATWEPLPIPRAIGLQMFILATFVGQVVMTSGSDFPCAMGMMMVENIPFMHTLAQDIIFYQGTGKDAMATTMVTFAISTILMGLCFLLLGQNKLGRAVSYFPRHFIIGCIGGIGVFVTQTGFEVSTGVAWSWSKTGLTNYMQGEVLPLWLAAAALVVLLNVVLQFIRYSLFPPLYFVSIVPMFYLMLLLLGTSVDDARANKWLFPHPPTTDCWLMWTLFDFGAVRWDLIFTSMPTLIALTCFGLMHVPINIPSLSISTGYEADMNRELAVHGWSNILSGLVGGLPNYLCYTNSLLYFKCQGGGQASGAALSLILGVAFVAGPGALAYVPRCMAGCLLIHVGLDLTREALVDSWNGFDTFEYVCVLLITATMTSLGMTPGLFLGLVSCAVSFTLQNMRHSEPVRGEMQATTLRSSVSRTVKERDFLNEALRGVTLVQLQGTLFFGNAQVLSSRVEEICSERRGHIVALVLDFTLVRSLESSAAEIIAKIYAIARRHGVVLIYNRGSNEGFPTASPLSDRLEKLSQSKEGLDTLYVANDLDDALAWIEELLLKRAGKFAPQKNGTETCSDSSGDPLQLRQLRALCPEDSKEAAPRLLAYMERREVAAHTQLWRRGDASDSCFLLSEGLLENTLEEEAGTTEECRPGCMVGEYYFLSGEQRLGRLASKEDSVLFVLRRETFREMLDKEPILGYVLSCISIRYLGIRCHNIANRIWDTRCLPI